MRACRICEFISCSASNYKMERGIFVKALSILPLEIITGFIPELLLIIVSENDTP